MYFKRYISSLLCLVMFIFSVCVAEKLNLPRIAAPRHLDTSINLANGGFIVVPNEPNYITLAETIKTKLQELAKTEYTVESKFDVKPAAGQSVIAIGNMLNNPIIENLYWNFYTMVGPRFPGARGYVIETVFQPLPFFAKNNIIILGGSNFDTSKQAVDDFVGGLKTADDCAVKSMLKVVEANGVDDTGYYRKTRGLRGFRGIAEYFHLTGDKKYLDEAMAILDEHCKKAEQNPDWILVWGDEIDSYMETCAWDFIQEHANISDADKLRYEQFFLDFMNKLAHKAEVFGKIKPGPVAAWNHTTIPLMGMYSSARYYQAHYGLDLQYILNQVKFYLDGQKIGYRVSCDAPGYELFSIRFCIAYYMMTRDYEYFNNGNAQKMCDLLFSQLDNNGVFGGAGDNRPGEKIKDGLAWDFFDYKKIRLAELLWFKKQAGFADVLCKSKFHPDTTPHRPDYLTGCVSIPMDGGMYGLTIKKNSDFRMLTLSSVPDMSTIVPLEKAFDKLQFRSFTDNGGEYLLVDGFGRGNHGHFDTGAIICATLDGCKFLSDSDYLISKSDEHSMVTVVKDGKAELPVPPFAELVNKVNFTDGAYSCTRIKNYNDSIWDRHIIWFKDRYFAVLDTVKAEQAGKFRFDCVWKTPDRGMEDFNGTELTSKCPGSNAIIKDIQTRTFHLRSVDAGWRNHRICEDDGKNWKIHQTKNLYMNKNDMTSWQNVFYVERPDAKGQVRQYKPIKLTDTIMRVDSDNPSVVIAGSQNARGLKIEGDFIYASPQEVLLVNVGCIKNGNEILFSSAVPTTIWLKKNTEILDANAIFKLSSLIMSKFPPRLQPVEMAGERPTQLKPLWQFGGKLSLMQERDLAVGDINGDAKDELLFCADKNLFCFNIDGKELWKYKHTENIYSCLVTNSRTAAVIAGTNGKILVFDSAGKLLKTVDVLQASSGQYGLQNKNIITHLSKRDFDYDGKEEIVIGLSSWQIHVFDSNLTPVWYNSLVLHGVTNIEYGSVKRMPNLLYVGDIYGGAYAFDIAKDKPEVLYRKGFTNIGATYISINDINKDGIDDIIAASECGRMSAFNGAVYGKKDKDSTPYKTIWSFNNYGFGYSGVKILPADNSVLIASSLSGYIYLMDAAKGKLKSVIDVTEPVSTFEIIADKIIAGTQNGFVIAMDIYGNILGKSTVSSGVLKIKPVGNYGYVVMTLDGQISLFESR